MNRLQQNARPRSAQAGFTLIELMIVVAILGVLSALAIPAFRTVLLRSKTSEASGNLAIMFKSAASYYIAERTEKGQDGAQLRACTVADPDTRLPLLPAQQKQPMPKTDPSFNALGFSVGDYVYFAYDLAGRIPAGECNVASNSNSVYTLFANGDLDGDGVTSTFELAVGSDVNNELYHARGLHIMNELE